MNQYQKRIEIHELHFPVDGYRFDVQVWRTADCGRTWYYCGEGKYFKTIEEVLAYQRDFLQAQSHDR